MKKLLKLAAAFAALALMFGFASCSDDDDEEEPATYKIAYMDGETLLTGLTPATYTEGTETALPTTATKDGHKFAGWYTESALTTKVEKIATTDTGDKTFYAKWDALYTVVYVDGSAVESLENLTLAELQEKAAQLELEENTHYTIDEANRKVQLTKEGEDKVKDTPPLPKTYKITYMDGETALTELTPATYTEGTETTLSATPTKEGYTFEGWYAESALTTKVEKIAATDTGDKTFYAKWTANTPPVTGTPITFDCTLATTEIGKAISDVHTEAQTAEKTMTAGTYDTVTLTGTISHPKTSMYILQLKKNDATASFEVKSGAKISILACSSGGGKKTYYTVSGAVTGNDTVENATAADLKELTLTATTDGTVTITAPSKMSDGTTNNNNLRIQKIIVTY